MTAEGLPAPANRGRDKTVEISSQVNKAATGENLPVRKPIGAPALGRLGQVRVAVRDRCCAIFAGHRVADMIGVTASERGASRRSGVTSQ